jgi:hypothetical protein
MLKDAKGILWNKVYEELHYGTLLANAIWKEKDSFIQKM